MDLELVKLHVHNLQALMRNKVGIVRSTEDLKGAARQLKVLHGKVRRLLSISAVNPTLYEQANILDVAQMIVSHSLVRRED